MKIAAILAPTLLALLWADTASALSCVPCGPLKAPRASFGQPDIGDVPANFALVLGSPYQQGAVPTATITGPGAPTLDCEPLADVEGDLRICRASGVSMGSTYTVMFDDPNTSNREHTVRVSAPADMTAPAAPTIVSIVERERGGDSGIGTGPQMGIDVDIEVTEDPSELTMEVGVTVGTNDERIWAVTGFVNEPNQIIGFVGNTFCQCDGFVDGEALLSNSTVRVRVVDRAGNRSPWTERVVPEPDPEACGCTATHSSGSGLTFGALLIGAFVMFRRKRRR